MKYLSKILWLIPLSVHVGFILATYQNFSTTVGNIGQSATNFSFFILEWLLVISLANVAFVFIHIKLPTFDDKMLSAPGKVFWLSSANNKAILIDKLKGICETTLLFINIFFMAVYLHIYQTNVTNPVFSISSMVLIIMFMVLPFLAIIIYLLITFRSLSVLAKKSIDE